MGIMRDREVGIDQLSSAKEEAKHKKYAGYALVGCSIASSLALLNQYGNDNASREVGFAVFAVGCAGYILVEQANKRIENLSAIGSDEMWVI